MHFFLHIPKCGGSTIRQYYASAFAPVLRIQSGPRGDVAAADFPRFQGVFSYGAIVGHLRFDQFIENNEAASYPDPFVIHSVIRNPVDRLISLYNFIKYNKVHPEHDQVRHLNGVRFVLDCTRNSQARYLGINACFANISEVSNHINLIDLETSVQRMHEYFTSNLKKEIGLAERKNITSRNFVKEGQPMLSRADFTESQLQQLEDAHSLDIRLHKLSREKKTLKTFSFTRAGG
ncbi:sulfotransferase family 2 domain-containing protein [Leisingera sp. NJS204]|uniref:sulfotransferase family 2 domain-containing protein n=1 Tax=Leisingera sp. NJS204 TaxID=2508307 RepID=UPI0013E94F62|nr:sulfotransferase family 2 domain-containing protein [Leisingera sp. NJS204]